MRKGWKQTRHGGASRRLGYVILYVGWAVTGGGYTARFHDTELSPRYPTMEAAQEALEAYAKKALETALKALEA